MATNAEFPPFEYLEDGTMVGAEIDMAYLIAEKLGMELEISNIDFDAALTGAATGKYDMESPYGLHLKAVSEGKVRY